MKTNATLSIHYLRCKLNTDYALKKITKEEKEKNNNIWIIQKPIL